MADAKIRCRGRFRLHLFASGVTSFRMFFLRFFTVFGLLVSCYTAQAATYYVDGDYQGENFNGLSWLSAFPSLDKALATASTNGGGEIWVKKGVYYPPEIDGQEASFTLGKNTQLYGGFRGNETKREERNWKINRTILSGDIGRSGSRRDNCYHVITGASGCTLDGFIVMRGVANGIDTNGDGGGLYLPENTTHFTIANCSFEKNRANRGGAVYCANASLTVTNSTFFSNSAETGGALFFAGKLETELTDSTFSANFASQDGGAVAIRPGVRALFRRCSFLSNVTDGEGGAIYARAQKEGDLLLGLAECSFNQNRAGRNGGAIFNQGPFAPFVADCRFMRNGSTGGTPAIANVSGVTLTLANSTYYHNRGAPGVADVSADTGATIVEKPIDLSTFSFATITPKKPKSDEPEPEPEPEPVVPDNRKLPDLFVYNTSGIKIKLQSLIGSKEYTVLATGCLTTPSFIKHYRKMEAAFRDYTGKDVGFLYLYRYLKHPENNRFLQPFSLRERARHVMEANKQLQTSVPWLCDTMDNQAAEWLEETGNDLFIFDKNGEEIFSGKLNDAKLSEQLEQRVGPVKEVTAPTALSATALPPQKQQEPTYFKPLKLNAEKNQYRPLQVTPLESNMPFYVKLRAEANQSLLITGDGQMYLGFRIDPLYGNVEWNNLGTALSYAINVPPRTAMSPSMNDAEKNTQSSLDSDPREFVLQVRKWNTASPLPITVTYSLHSSEGNWTRNITQKYIVYLAEDRFAGSVFGRQDASPATTEKTADKEQLAKLYAARYTTYMRKYDVNRDGKLSAAEVPPEIRNAWDRADQNKNGFLEEDEYIRFRESQQTK